ncbi:MAG: hypothetical protein E4H13_02720 [Calditrichales bacterium]|nr:MAG: hypothetical protein E4H13_02720 [Calditrichales bacterium]
MNTKTLGKYSFGVGDRFAHQAKAQLQAMIMASEQGVAVTPVWNKSFREHSIIKSEPAETRTQADAAVKALNWQGNYFVDADHVNQDSVGFFMQSSDFFTLDVADYIGKPAEDSAIRAFIGENRKYLGSLHIPGINEVFQVDESRLNEIAGKYLYAVKEAGKIYRKILEQKGSAAFIVEVSMDETDQPQTPLEIFFILSALSGEKIPVDTLAPKFSGRFNKGVDYVGDLALFKKEFEQDLAVIQFAVSEFSFSPDLKLSVHSGSDKFSIYPIIRDAIRAGDTGLHIKTAGTTWLEEIIGLAMAGGGGLDLAKEVYRRSLERYDELCKPYATVIDINKNRLPAVTEVRHWDGTKFADALRHDQTCERYNPDMRQLLHVGYKVAAEMKSEFYPALEKYEATIAMQVTENIFSRHIKPLFL